MSPQAFDLTIRCTREPHLLSRIVRVLTWQGVLVREMHTRADADSMVLWNTLEGEDWHVTRLLGHFQRIRGVEQVEAIDAETGEAPQPTLLAAPAAR